MRTGSGVRPSPPLSRRQTCSNNKRRLKPASGLRAQMRSRISGASVLYANDVAAQEESAALRGPFFTVNVRQGGVEEGGAGRGADDRKQGRKRKRNKQRAPSRDHTDRG